MAAPALIYLAFQLGAVDGAWIGGADGHRHRLYAWDSMALCFGDRVLPSALKVA